MTLEEIREVLVTADPDIMHYFSMSDKEAYSYWEETRRLNLIADGRHQEGWRFYVHRFSKTEGDTIAATIFDTLDENPRTSVVWTIDFENDTGYIHHIFECEGY